MTQNQIILKHLKKHGSITPLQAINKYMILRLSARIFDLKDSGHNIKTTIIKKGNKRFAKYSL